MKQPQPEAREKENIKQFFLETKKSMKEQEARMEEYDIPDRDFHIKLHNELLRTIISFEFQLDDASSEDLNSMTVYVEDWMDDHYLFFDKPLESFINLTDYVLEKEV